MSEHTRSCLTPAPAGWAPTHPQMVFLSLQAEGHALSSGSPSPAAMSLLLTAASLLAALALLSSGPTLLGLRPRPTSLVYWAVR